MFKFSQELLLLLICINSKVLSEEVRGRLFGGPYTSTVTTSKVVTSIVPSSCVQVEPTLPPCRNVRYLKFPKLPTFSFNHPDNQKVVTNWKTEKKIEMTPLGWGEYLGLYAPTVTVTTTNLHITTVQDPSVVVTFAVKGCRPLKMPLDLDRCPQSQQIPIEETLQTTTVASTIAPVATILPTAIIPVMSSTSVVGFLESPDLPEKQTLSDNSNLLEPSLENFREDRATEPTDTLTQINK